MIKSLETYHSSVGVIHLILRLKQPKCRLRIETNLVLKNGALICIDREKLGSNIDNISHCRRPIRQLVTQHCSACNKYCQYKKWKLLQLWTATTTKLCSCVARCWWYAQQRSSACNATLLLENVARKVHENVTDIQTLPLDLNFDFVYMIFNFLTILWVRDIPKSSIKLYMERRNK